ncbi:transcriptional regulator [Melioribacter roseus P3M-2]|uniref:Transcriptional regulator n=1 Tax=Melioribacter roseus (strain DSM 23840 / JCM 17771 / VKM B-2668 / P3M-2) TaxID=1191523 RepID=I7A010_MELRP|nr:MarR family transcriptional regulator [Melioribacter roseus]AFN74588.1 transcriptional regulator [Melioribacter roseus P3M-2]
MRLEEEIKQKKFRNEFHKLTVNLHYTNNWLLNIHKSIFERFGITPNQFNILRILRGQHPGSASVNLLKERMLDKTSDVSRLVERLRVKGLVERNRCPNDRRRADVIITEKGLELLKEIDKYNDEFDRALSNLSENEAKLLNDLLDKMRG